MFMRVLLVSANREQINMPAYPLGLACVAAAATAAGHDTEMIDYMQESTPEAALEKSLAEFRPGALGISIRNIDDQSMARKNRLIDDARDAVTICRNNSGAPVILGGAGYSIFPESALDYCGADMGISGEGEHAFPKLLSLLESGGDIAGTPGLHLPGRGMAAPRRYEKNLDNFPLPDYSAWSSIENKRDVWIPVQTRRGCAMDCSYCSTSSIEGRHLRKRSPGSAVEMLRGVAAAGFKQTFFTDNTFNLPPAYAKELCREMISNCPGMRWRCIVYPKHVDAELVGLMEKAGCVEVSLGFESGHPGMLKNLNKRFGPADVKETSRLFSEHCIRQTGFLLLGSPGETRETVAESVRFMESLGLDMVKITVGVRVYPDTALCSTAIEEGLIAPEQDLLEPVFYISRETAGWLPDYAAELAESHDNWFM